MPNSIAFPSQPCTMLVIGEPHHFPGYFWRKPGESWREVSWAVWCIFRWLRIDGEYRWNEGMAS